VSLEPVGEDWDRAVAIVAHPDDLEYGMASAVARWTAQGKQVSYLLATKGEAGIDGMEPRRAAEVREAEQRASAGIVGVHDVIFLDHPDGAVEYGLALRRDLAGAIRSLRPQVVFTMNFELTWGESGNVNHADHRAVGLGALDACRDAANRWLFGELGEPWSGITNAYVAASSHPTHFVDVSRTIDKGIESLRAHSAYIEGLGTGFDPDEFLRNMGGYGGMAAGCEYAVLCQAFNAV